MGVSGSFYSLGAQASLPAWHRVEQAGCLRSQARVVTERSYTCEMGGS